ncbi:MAG TPA: hypothetical protein DFR83_17725 [Deltaproteobacteria bacterium]|nr:hypothetical protein [Deltaproteobacteria bacterium]
MLDSEQKVDDTRTTDPERCMVPHAEYPFAIDPEQGWLSSANNDPAGHSLDDILENDDWYIGGPWNDGARQHRITERLTELAGSADLESMAELQGDHHSPFGQYLAPHMVETLAEVRAWSESDGATTEAERRAVELYRTDAVRFLEVEERLLMWMNRGFMARSGVVTSYHTPAEDDGRDAVATTIFNAWKGWLVHRALDDEAIGRVWRTSGNTSRLRTLGLMFEGRGADNPSGLASWNPATEESAYWDVLDSEVIETSHEVVLASLLDALELLESEPTGPGEGGFGTSDMDQWLWGLRHTVRFDSVLSEFLGDSGSFSILTDQFSITPDVIPLAEGLTPDDPRYGLEGFPRPGDTESVDAANFGFNRDRFTYGSGPVFRMVFALGPDGVDGLNILPGGQSALTDSPYFADQAAAWLGNDAWPLRFTVAEVVAGATGREVLLPASGETCGQQFE